MSMKKWLVACGVVGLLVLAYFWGGNIPKKSNPERVSSIASQTQPSEKSTKEQEQQVEHQTEQQATQQEVQPDQTPPAKELPKDGSPKEEPVKVTTDQDAIKEPAKAKTSETPSSKSEVTPKSDQQKEAPPAKTEKADKSTAAKKPEAKKDKYLTDPVPAGKPKPVEWQDVSINKKKILTATLSVTSKSILDNLDDFNPDKLEMLPEDGVIYKAQKVTFYEGESVFDVLLREMRNNKIHMEFSMTPIYNSNYIEGINNIYEFDCGELSGWMYKVNGWFPNYGSSRYVLKDSDVIEWVYTCDLGRDVGGDTAVGGGKG
ncbi:DUF4430 domain-containing protein [Paenibacillus terrigena]|uniref:DUF4430 domain-containing protein n=1 Tax=Paenibacillus terrigena TaxID=369333 RepID=UPI00035D515F|nr:DUF4430 domain-containing protein [Paenibacillus terrigena]